MIFISHVNFVHVETEPESVCSLFPINQSVIMNRREIISLKQFTEIIINVKSRVDLKESEVQKVTNRNFKYVRHI